VQNQGLNPMDLPFTVEKDCLMPAGDYPSFTQFLCHGNKRNKARYTSQPSRPCDKKTTLRSSRPGPVRPSDSRPSARQTDRCVYGRLTGLASQRRVSRPTAAGIQRQDIRKAKGLSCIHTCISVQTCIERQNNPEPNCDLGTAGVSESR